MIIPFLKPYQRSIFGHTGIGIYLNTLGINCPSDQVVPTIDECRAAAVALKFTFMKKNTNIERPAGCYYHKDHGDTRFYFNTIVDPSSTENINTRFKGVCAGGIISF